MDFHKFKKISLFFLIIFIILINSVSIATNDVEQNVNVSYCTHIQNKGWENNFSKQNGEISGTSGQGLRLEAIKIKIDDVLPDAEIQYQVHAQNVGWQSWRKNGEMAGTSGQGLRLEAIKIKLINAPDYTVEYRVHVQNIGWQNWKQDGVIAGTTGQGLRLEAIQVRIVKKEKKGQINIETNLNNESYFDIISVSGWRITNVENTKLKIIVDDMDYTEKTNIQYISRNDLIDKISYGSNIENEKPGFSFSLNAAEMKAGIHSLKIKLMTEDETTTLATYNGNFKTDKDIHIFYKSHVQGIGWQNYVKDGILSGTTGRFLRIEAINVKSYNLPEGVNLKYQAHVQGIGWQDWVDEGKNMGTIGQFKRVEAFRIKLENEENYTVEYRAHVQGIGWQNWKQDGAVAGTIGKCLRIEAIQIRIVEKETKGDITIENNLEKQTFYDEVSINGWKMTNVENTKLKVFLNDVDYTEETNIEYYTRNDLIEKIDYGDETQNSKPGFIFSINTDNIETGKYKLELKLVTSDEKTVLATNSNEIFVDKDMHITYQSHVQGIGWQDYVMDGAISGTIGNGCRIEAINIKAYNLPEGVTLKYQAHVQGIGWQGWKTNGDMIGTTGEFKRIEGIKFELQNTDEYSIIYRAHVQDYGWQDWANDGEMSGTVGVGKRIEAIEIKIVDKITEERTTVYINSLPNNLTNEIHNIRGYIMSNVKDIELQLLIDGNKIDGDIPRIWDQEVYNKVKGYGGEKLNPIPRFLIDIDFSKYSLGTHTITAQVVSTEGEIIKQASRTINLIKKIEYSTGIYGYSGLTVNGDPNGSALKYYKYGSGPNVFFATFCVHGFEDKWSKDGTELVNIANQFWETLKTSNDYDLAEKWTIYILPTVNPDGVNYGWTNNGPGRTTIYSAAPENKGIDLNRSWSTDFVYQSSSRNYTGTEPFQAYEARYLRDFLLAHKSTNGQTILVDLHGWTQQLIGDEGIRDYYRQQFSENEDVSTYGKGYLINWARTSLGSSSRAARTALIELPSYVNSSTDVTNNNFAGRYINATLSMLRGII